MLLRESANLIAQVLAREAWKPTISSRTNDIWVALDYHLSASNCALVEYGSLLALVSRRIGCHIWASDCGALVR
jgi:hypothetical protein